MNLREDRYHSLKIKYIFLNSLDTNYNILYVSTNSNVSTHRNLGGKYEYNGEDT